MAFPSSFRTTMAALALACTADVGTAHATDNGLYDWQPCPDSLAAEGETRPTKKWEVMLSPYTHHWNDNPKHRPVKLISVDSHVSGGRFCGLALFTNSFGQASTYVYVGKQWDGILGNPKLFTKVSAGLLWGYRDEYKEKIPFNHLGIAPAVIPSLGYYVTPKDSAQVHLLGTAGLLFAYTRSF